MPGLRDDRGRVADRRPESRPVPATPPVHSPASRRLATQLALVTLGTSGAAASPVDAAANTAPVVDSLDDVSVLDGPAHHCGPNESHVDGWCIYNPPCDATCVDIEAMGDAFAR